MLFQRMRHLALWTLVVQFGWLVPLASAAAQESCETEAATFNKLAATVQLAVTAPRELKFGSSFNVTWQAGAQFPSKMPVYAIVAVSGALRVQVPESPELGPVDNKRSVEGQGFFVLPSGTRGPLGIGFGGATSSRIFIPLYQPGSKLSGAFSVRMLTAGPQEVRAGLVSFTSCGERLKTFMDGKVLVTPGDPVVVIQDFYDTSQPQRVVLSNSGRYRLHVEKDRYRVFDVATGAKLLDRAGYNPNLSPTERFLAASVVDDTTLSQPNEDGFEVIDLLTLDVVARPTGPVIGWVHNDAFLLDGTGVWGSISVLQTLMSPPHGSGDTDGAHFERSWTDDRGVTLDLDNAILVRTRGIEEIASGFSRWNIHEKYPPDWSLKKELAAHYAVRPLPLAKGWAAREPILFSHSITPKDLVDGDGKPVSPSKVSLIGSNRRLSFAVNKHRQLSAADRQLLMGSKATEANASRGDWRTAARVQRREARRRSSSDNKPSWHSALQPFGLSTAVAGTKETVSYSGYADKVAFNRLAEEKQTDAEWARIEQRGNEFVERLVRDVPALHAALPALGEIITDEFRSVACIRSDVAQAWRWDVAGKPVWVIHCLTSSGGAGQSASSDVILLDGRPGDGQVINLSKAVTGPNDTLSTDTALQYGEMLAELYFDRYLILTSRMYQTVLVYDLAASKTALLVNAPDATLINDVVLTEDARHAIQFSSNGQFFIHELESSKTILQGRQVDDEVIVFSGQGYYWSTYEGAHFVHLRFPGLGGLQSFKQFEPVLDRPDVIQASLKSGSAEFPGPTLNAPPELHVDLDRSPGADGSKQRLKIRASSADRLDRLQVYADGAPIAVRQLNGRDYVGDIDIPRQSKAWLTTLAIDSRGLASRPQAIWTGGAKTGGNKLKGVIVGVSAYLDPDLILNYARSDAERLGAALEKNMGGYYGTVGIERLLDADVTPVAVLGALRRAVSDMTARDTLVFSFAGHGLDNGGKLYLVPAGYRADDAAESGLAWSDVANVLSTAPGRVIVFLDACHAGRSGSEAASTNDAAVSALLSGSRAPMLVFAASKGRQFSYEHSKWGGGLFTHAILQALSVNRPKHDRDGNGVIDVSELYTAAKEIVVRESEGDQSPWLVRRDLVGNFGLF